MARPFSTREVLDFEQRCSQCKHIRDLELFEQSPDGTTCDLCTRKAERIAQGLFKPDGNRASSSSTPESATADALSEWRQVRRKELQADGVMPWDIATRLVQDELSLSTLVETAHGRSVTR
jgi:hypothetical protein